MISEEGKVCIFQGRRYRNVIHSQEFNDLTSINLIIGQVQVVENSI